MGVLLDVCRRKDLWRLFGYRRLILLAAFVTLLVWIWHCYREGDFSPELLDHYRAANPVLAIYLFVAVYIVAVIAILPSLPLNLAAGLFWGGLLGGVYSTIGVTIGGWAAFLISRYFLGAAFKQRLAARWERSAGREFNINSWKILAFVRMNPIIPSGPLNYMLGLSSISSAKFLWTTFVFLLPPSIAMAYIGSTLKTFVAEQANASSLLRGILIISAAVTGIAVLRVGSRLLRKT